MNKLFKKLILVVSFTLTFFIPRGLLTVNASNNPYSGVKGEYTDYIVYGFDMVKDPMPDSNKVKDKPILDKEKLEQEYLRTWYDAKPGNVSFDVSTIIENSTYELNKSLAEELNLGYKTPETNYSTFFDISNSFNSKVNTYHGVLIANSQHEKYSLALNTNTLKNYLSADFVNAVNAGNYEYVFNNYGTHLIQSASIGARLYVVFNTTESSTLTKEELKAGIKESYSNMTAGTSVTASASYSTLQKNITYHIKGNGGNVIIPQSFEQTNAYEKWASSINDNTLAMYQVNNCIPIWELFTDLSTKRKLQLAYTKYLNEHLIITRDNIPFITNIRVIKDKESNVSQRISSDEFVVRNASSGKFEYSDLNKNIATPSLYLVYKTGTKQAEKISDMILQKSTSNSVEHPLDGYEFMLQIAPKRIKEMNYIVFRYKKVFPYIYLHYNRKQQDFCPGYQALCTRKFSDQLNDNWVLINSNDNTPLNLIQGSGKDPFYLFGYVDPVLSTINNLIKENENTINYMSYLIKYDEKNK